MKKLFLMLFAFAMCESTAAIADDRVTATSEFEFVVDVGVTECFVATDSFNISIMSLDAESGYTFIKCPKSTEAVSVTDDVGWQPLAQYDYSIYTPDSPCLTFLDLKEPANIFDTDLSFRKARDGLNC